MHISTDLLIDTTTTGPNEFRGTYVHPDIAIHLAQWISAKFAVAKIAPDKAKYGNAQQMSKERIGEHKRDFNDFHITFETINERTKTTKLHREILSRALPTII